MPDLLTIAEAAQTLRVSTRTLEREAADGRLAIVRIRSLRFVAAAELERYKLAAIAQGAACQSAGTAIDGRSEFAQATAAALSKLYRPELPKQTRGRSKLRSSSASSPSHLAAVPIT